MNILRWKDRRVSFHLDTVADRLLKLWIGEHGLLGKGIVWQAPVHALFSAGPNAALLTAPDVALFLAEANYELVDVSEIHETLGTDGGAVTLDIVKATGTQAVGSGTTMLATTFDLKATINTVVRKAVADGGLTTTLANRRLARGNRAGLNFTGTMTAVTGVHVHAIFKPLTRPSY